MKDQVFLAPSGEIAIGIPLFRVQHNESLGKMEGFNVWLSKSKPLAYVIECEIGARLFNADFIHKNLIKLGDL